MSEVKTNKISSLASNNDITIDPDGTGDTIIASGNLGVGTTSPDHTLTVSASSSPVLEMEQTSGGPYKANLVLNGNDLEVRGSSGTIEFYNGNNDGASSTERMRIDSGGRLHIGLTNGGSQLNVENSANIAQFRMTSSSASQETNLTFIKNGSEVGYINCTTSSTIYGTSSDYRLKENVVDMSGAIDRVKALAPKRFNFIVDPDTTVDGFLAHEAMTVVPEAISGTHNEVDDDGNAVMQGIDQSKLVPLLTGALKEAITKIEALEARVTALEDA